MSSLQNALTEFYWLRDHLGAVRSQYIDLSIVVERAVAFVNFLYYHDDSPRTFKVTKCDNEVSAGGNAGEFMRCLVLLLDTQESAEIEIRESDSAQLEIFFHDRGAFEQVHDTDRVQALLERNAIKSEMTDRSCRFSLDLLN